jgi:hypothetical protein
LVARSLISVSLGPGTLLARIPCWDVDALHVQLAAAAIYERLRRAAVHNRGKSLPLPASDSSNGTSAGYYCRAWPTGSRTATALAAVGVGLSRRAGIAAVLAHVVCFALTLWQLRVDWQLRAAASKASHAGGAPLRIHSGLDLSVLIG